MKLTRIQIQNVLGARAVDAVLRQPVALFAGANGAGKSSVEEAVRMALTGEAVRVGLKKEYGQLVSEGADGGFCEIHTPDSVFNVAVPDGKGLHADITALPYVLDAQRFARLDANARRSFLFGLFGLQPDGHAIRERLLKEHDQKRVETILPMLRAGFEAAHKDCTDRAKEAVVTDFDFGERTYTLDLYRTDRLDCYRAVADGKPWMPRIGWSRVLAGLRKALPRVAS